MVSCGSLKAEIAWVAGADNNDPVTEYTVYYNTSFDKPVQYTEGARTSARKLSAEVCWMLLHFSDHKYINKNYHTGKNSFACDEYILMQWQYLFRRVAILVIAFYVYFSTVADTLLGSRVNNPSNLDFSIYCHEPGQNSIFWNQYVSRKC
jgi:hypothetical protein